MPNFANSGLTDLHREAVRASTWAAHAVLALCAGVGTAGRAAFFGIETKDRSPDRTEKRQVMKTTAGKTRGQIHSNQKC
jgi:hypothetical protein